MNKTSGRFDLSAQFCQHELKSLKLKDLPAELFPRLCMSYGSIKSSLGDTQGLG